MHLFCDADPDISPTYPPEVIVPRPTPEVDLERVAPFYRDSRFPVVTWRNRENGALLFRGAAAAGRRYAHAALIVYGTLLWAPAGVLFITFDGDVVELVEYTVLWYQLCRWMKILPTCCSSLIQDNDH